MGREIERTAEFAFRRRYNLPPTDPRYLDATLEQILVDYWANRHADDPKLAEEIEDEDIEETLADIEAAAADDFGPPVTEEFLP